MELLTPLLDRVDYHFSRSRVTFCVLGALIFAVAFAYPALMRPMPFASPGAMIAAAAAIAGACLLVGIAVVVTLRCFRREGAAVTVDQRGILDRRIGPYVLPWSQIRDVRFLDRRGHRIGIELDRRILAAPRGRRHRFATAFGSDGVPAMAVIDTFFLCSPSGNRALDFLMPITAMAPFDLSDISVTEDMRHVDARYARRHRWSIAGFCLVAVLLPAAAAVYLLAL